jgi:hypothetical protein
MTGEIPIVAAQDNVAVSAPVSAESHPVSQKKMAVEDNSINYSTLSSSPKSNRTNLKGEKKKSRGLIGMITRGICHVLSPKFGNRNPQNKLHSPATKMTNTIPRVRGGVRLRGCLTDEEHIETAREVVRKLCPLKGKFGLLVAGFEYRTVPITVEDSQSSTIKNLVPELMTEQEKPRATEELQNVTKLFHVESNTPITLRNRIEFIADGDMYDQIARLCQEHAQDIMLREGNLEWVKISEAGNNTEPIRAIVSSSINKDEDALDSTPTLLIATGKGRVRAGVFSRQHLLVTGIEYSTALPIVREARKRSMNMIMLDPNVHGDRLGMVTFEKSMAKLFHRWESDTVEHSKDIQPPLKQRDLFVLSHSQSGAQLARYLLDKSKHYVPHIRAVVFTDSTHNIQWARQDKDLERLLESEKSLYFKVSKERSETSLLTPLESLGSEVDTDHFWQHRFGRISTRCAGTNEHSLTNWFARHHIWDHFDSHLKESAF